MRQPVGGLRPLAESKGIPVYQPKQMKDPEVYDIFVKLQPDLNVMVFVTDIIPLRILNLPRLGTIQYHPSLLPKYRGGSAINWAIIKGETRTGLTVFWPDKGVDTGPILLQKEVEIGPDDTAASLYFNKLFPLGVEAMLEAVELVKNDKAPRIPQDESQATSDPLCTEGRTAIDWDKPVAQVYNLIRGANPSPGAVTTFQGKKLKVLDAARLDEPQLSAPKAVTLRLRRATPGQVVAITPDGFVVASQDGSILVKRVMPEGGAKIKAPEFVVASSLRIGDRLGEEVMPRLDAEGDRR
jgi:methionyl-tRNA formyltransferase